MECCKSCDLSLKPGDCTEHEKAECALAFEVGRAKKTLGIDYIAQTISEKFSEAEMAHIIAALAKNLERKIKNEGA